MGVSMVRFCGQDSCLIDANGRLKLSPRFLDDFGNAGGTTVLRSLPEGALGVYPEAIWQQMRQGEANAAMKAGTSAAYRRQLRLFGAMSETQEISKQGRLTIPVLFRERLGLVPGASALVIGTEIGVEIWEAERWRRELELLDQHELQKAQADMAAELAAVGQASPPT
jgi:DNA-binding transcriptional regulator/RsmH inhibitor MraZ